MHVRLADVPGAADREAGQKRVDCQAADPVLGVVHVRRVPARAGYDRGLQAGAKGQAGYLRAVLHVTHDTDVPDVVSGLAGLVLVDEHESTGHRVVNHRQVERSAPVLVAERDEVLTYGYPGVGDVVGEQVGVLEHLRAGAVERYPHAYLVVERRVEVDPGVAGVELVARVGVHRHQAGEGTGVGAVVVAQETSLEPGPELDLDGVAAGPGEALLER